MGKILKSLKYRDQNLLSSEDMKHSLDLRVGSSSIFVTRRIYLADQGSKQLDGGPIYCILSHVMTEEEIRCVFDDI